MSCRLFCDLMDCSPPSFSVQGISQARILEWVTTSFSRGYPWLRELNPCLLHCRWILLILSHQGNPHIYIYTWSYHRAAFKGVTKSWTQLSDWTKPTYHSKKEILITITVFISATGCVVIADIYNYFRPLPIPYSLHLQQILQLVVDPCLVEWTKSSFLKGLGH